MSQFPGQNQQGRYPPGFFEPGGGYDRMKATGARVGPDPKTMMPNQVPPNYYVGGPGATRLATQADYDAILRQRAGDARNKGLIKAGIVGTGALIGGGALSAMFSGGAPAAAGSGGWSMPGVSAPVFGGGSSAATGPIATAGKVGLGSRLGSMFNSKGMDLGVNAGLSLLGMKSQNKAAEQARLDTLKGQQEALALQRQQLELEARNADLDREDAKALNAAINELKKRELDAAEEARAFDRGLIEAREARAEPYRRRGVQALDRLASMWSLG